MDLTDLFSSFLPTNTGPSFDQSSGGLLSGLGSLFSSGNTLTQSQAQARRNTFDAQWASRLGEYNAQLIEFNTEAQVKKVAFQLKTLDQNEDLSVTSAERATAKTLGAQRARLGNSGVMLDQGSTDQAQTATQADGDWNVAVIRYQSAVKRQELSMDQELTQVRGDMQASMARALGGYQSERSQMLADDALSLGGGSTGGGLFSGKSSGPAVPTYEMNF